MPDSIATLQQIVTYDATLPETEPFSVSGVFIIIAVILIALIALLVTLVIMGIKALQKYLKSSNVRKEKNMVKRSLGETLKAHRTRCKMTQEFVAESLGVSRQAVSKWESGASDPSTSNLLALQSCTEFQRKNYYAALQ